MTDDGHQTLRIDASLRAVLWGTLALLMLAPAVAMRFTDEVNWTASDFVFAAVLFGAVGVAFEAAMRMTRSWAYRFAAGFAALAAFLILWVNAAVGMIAEGSNAYNLSFVGVAGLALLGALAARFRAGRMALVMLVAAVAHLSVALAGMSVDPLGGTFSAAFAGLWLLSAALFRLAAGEQRPGAAA